MSRLNRLASAEKHYVPDTARSPILRPSYNNKADNSRPLWICGLAPLVSFSAALRQHAADHRSQFERGLLHSLAEHRETIVRHP
jgi:hypothetical protein